MSDLVAHVRVPRSKIFTTFLRIGLTSFGGGASAHIHEAVVDRNAWLEEDQFVEALTIARSMPGTNVSNLAAFVGMTLGGLAGAVLAVVGVVLPGALLVLGIAAAYVHLAPHTHLMKSLLHGTSLGATGVMAVLAIDAIRAGLKSRAGAIIVGAAFLSVAALALNVLWPLLVLVPVASYLNRKPA